jgi:hypothetical protein
MRNNWQNKKRNSTGLIQKLEQISEGWIKVLIGFFLYPEQVSYYG